MNLGIMIIFITLSGYLSNWINWRFLNYKLIHAFYFVGAFVHEASHAILCLLTGAKIMEFKVFSRQPQVVHSDSRIPLLGQALISLAPLLGGLLFLFLVNRFWLVSYFDLPQISGWRDILSIPLGLLSQINLLEWQSWVMIFLFLNVGAMIGPSPKDLKNFWPLLVLFFFVESPLFLNLAYLALGLILTNVVIQVFLIVLIALAGTIRRIF